METDTELGTILLNNADEFRTAVKEGRVKELAAEMTAELDAQDGVPMAGSVADVCAQLGTDITD